MGMPVLMQLEFGKYPRMELVCEYAMEMKYPEG
jgi:hypothetical protein